MSRGNLILLGLLALAVGLWLVGRSWEKGKVTGPAPRLFPVLNREAADGIEVSGGPSGTRWGIARVAGGSDWALASAGGYPVKRAEVERFLDAVSNLRKDNEVGTSAELRARTHTDEKNGRLVRVLKGDEPMAEFYVGKNPKQGYYEFFVRKAGEDAIYRTQTLLTKEQEQDTPADPYGARPSGFEWHSYTESLTPRWLDSAIWDLGNAEVDEIWLSRPGVYDAKVLRQAQDKWDLVEEGKEPVPADADVADGILSVVRRLSLYEVLGPYEGVAKEYGLDKPETTLVMKLRKKVEKPAPAEGEPKEPKEGEEKKEEYTTFHRSIEVGKKVSRPRYDSYSDETKSEDYYAIHVGPEKDIENVEEKKRAGYVFLVRDYTVSQIRKDLADLAAKPQEGEEKGPGEEEAGVKPGEEKPGEEKPAEEKPADQKPAEEKPPEEKPADEKPAGEGEKPAGEGGAKEPAGGG